MLAPLITTNRFDRDLERLRPHYPRIDNVMTGVFWGLSKDKYAGKSIPGRENRYIYLTSPVDFVVPIFRVIYKFSESNPNQIVLLAIGSSASN